MTEPAQDRKILGDLACEVADIAALPVPQEKAVLWKRLILWLVSLVGFAGGCAGGDPREAASTEPVREPPRPVRAVRFPQNPIIRPEMSSSIGTNINGPSLIRVPEWIERPLGRYYLFFAHHGGKHIRLAYADALDGPWRIHEPGVLRLEETAARGHIASPDVHVDPVRRQIRMYFHGPAEGGQRTFLATSSDGLRFAAGRDVLGDFYFRVFRWGGWWYAVAKEGNLFRSRDGAARFEPGPNPFRFDAPGLIVRHSAVRVVGDRLDVFYSRIGDAPERILLSSIPLTEDWNSWRASAPVTILEPRETYEGADLPVAPSRSGAASGRVRQLRDPAIFEEAGRAYLLYSVAGERGIAIAELKGV